MWQAVKVKAKQRGETITDVIVRALKRVPAGLVPELEESFIR